MKIYNHTLKEITDILLTPVLDYSTVRNACSSLCDFFYQISGFDDSAKENQAHIQTPAGLAVSPFSAAFCVIDMIRTRNFLQGIKEAIDFRLKINPEKPVIIFYAGTGPFATLLIPLITQFEPAQLKMVLLEINPASVNYLNKVISRLMLQPYIIDVVQADAALYIIPDKHQPDIIISETMKPGLEKEPQVSIVSNLLSQCNFNPILIPRLVKVEACFAGNRAKNNHELIRLKTLLELDAETVLRIKNNPDDVPAISNGITIIISEPPIPTFTRLILGTSIQIFNGHWLHFNETSLTTQHVVMEIAAIKKFPARLLFKYQMKNKPGFNVVLC